MMCEKLSGKVIVKTPFLCICCIKIDGISKTLNPFKKNQRVDVPYGKHSIILAI